MKPFLASLIHAFILIFLGIWGYLGSETPSLTALIPAGTGVVLLLLNNGLRKENRVVAHVVVLITILTLAALVKPITGAFNRSDTPAMIRIGIMMVFTIFALVIFFKSFRDARKQTNHDTSK